MQFFEKAADNLVILDHNIQEGLTYKSKLDSVYKGCVLLEGIRVNGAEWK